MRIRWTEPALRGFHSHLRLHSGTWQHLTDYPEIGRAGRKADTRELVLSGLPYIAIYRLREQTVEVLRILHGAQKWP
jgi:plasmid stabilization system protein ParE